MFTHYTGNQQFDLQLNRSLGPILDRPGMDRLTASVLPRIRSTRQITELAERLAVRFDSAGDGVAASRHLADFYARNGHALTTLLSVRGGGDCDLGERLRQMCRSVFKRWAAGRIDDQVLPLASDIYASVVLTLIERGSAKPLTDEELAAIDRARELFIGSFGAQ